jgi:hypothetical protein
MKKRKKKLLNYPCKCGHIRSLHDYVPYNKNEWCDGDDRFCPCENFTPDNLSYLQNLYKRRKKK